MHEQSEWSWNESDEDWNGVIDREAKNKEKKKKKYYKKKEIQTYTTRAASLIIGVHPVTRASIDHFAKNTKNYNEAKKMADREYLENVLMFDEDEMKTVKITDTQVSKKGDDVLYIAMDDQDTLTEMRIRIAELQNPAIFVRNCIPPQYFARYCVMNTICREMREKDKDLKTQIRFAKTDIEILMKCKGTDEPFKVFKLPDDVINDVPKFDFSINWIWKEEKPPRRRLDPLKGNIEVPSMKDQPSRKNPSVYNQVSGRSSPKNQQTEKSSQSTRQLSGGSTNMHKKTKKIRTKITKCQNLLQVEWKLKIHFKKKH